MKFRQRIAMLVVAVLGITVGLAVTPAVASGPPAPTGLQASANADGTVHFQWNGAPGASAYLLEVSPDSSFPAGSVTGFNTYALDFISSYPLVTDVATELHWRVSSYTQAFTGQGLPSVSTTISLGATAAPVPISPAGEGVVTISYPAPTVFRWSPVVGAVGYELQYTSDAFDSGNPGLVTTSVKGSSFTPPAPLKRRDDTSQQTLTWKWRVRAVMYNGTTSANPARFGPFSTESQFQIHWNTAPGNLLPKDIAEVPGEIQSDLKFSWDAVPGAAKYRIALGTGRNQSDGSILSATTIDVFTTTYVPTATLINDNRFWQVTPLDVAGNSGTASPVLEFQKKWQSQVEPTAANTGGEVFPLPLTGSLPTAEPVDIYPADFELKWEPLPRATFYQVVVYGPEGNVYCRTPATSATIIAYKFDGTGLSDNLRSHGDCLWVQDASRQILPNGDWTYSWQVRAIDYAGSVATPYQASASSVGTFPAEVVLSNWSPRRYFNVIEDDRAVPPSTAVTLDQVAFSADNPSSRFGQPAPVMTWNQVGGGGDEGDEFAR